MTGHASEAAVEDVAGVLAAELHKMNSPGGQLHPLDEHRDEWPCRQQAKALAAALLASDALAGIVGRAKGEGERIGRASTCSDLFCDRAASRGEAGA